jgi:hypothetical protein
VEINSEHSVCVRAMNNLPQPTALREPSGLRIDPTGGHSAQWGLASILLAGLVLILFPLLMLVLHLYEPRCDLPLTRLKQDDNHTGLVLGCFLPTCLIGVALLAVVCAVTGLSTANTLQQPRGLPMAGMVLSVFAVLISFVLLSIMEAEAKRRYPASASERASELDHLSDQFLDSFIRSDSLA